MDNKNSNTDITEKEKILNLYNQIKPNEFDDFRGIAITLWSIAVIALLSIILFYKNPVLVYILGAIAVLSAILGFFALAFSKFIKILLAILYKLNTIVSELKKANQKDE